MKFHHLLVLIHIAAEATGEFIGNKIAETVIKSYDGKNLKKNLLKKWSIRQKREKKILNQLRQVLYGTL